MSEIKSTLELALEKTSHLNLSERERHEQKLAEFKSRVHGVIQKRLDRAIKEETAAEDLVLLQKEYGLDCRKIVIEHVLDALTLQGAKEPLFGLLGEVCGISTDGLRTISAGFEQKKTTAVEDRYNDALARLNKKHGISGTAVVPNLEADQTLSTELTRLEHAFKKEIQAEIDRIGKACRQT